MEKTESAGGQTILVVDDIADNTILLDRILSPHYRVKVASNGEKALAIAASERPPDIILLDVMMPGMDGFEVCRRLKADEKTRKIPIIFVTAMGEVKDEAQGLTLGAVDYITKPASPPIVRARVKTHLELHDQNVALEAKVAERTRELEISQAEVVFNMQKLDMAQTEMLERLAQAAEFRDDETGRHTHRVGELSYLMAGKLGLSEFHCNMLRRAAPLHDVGKIGIPDEILLKPGRLTEAEYETMKTHTTMGVSLLRDGKSPLVRMAEIVALTHHERWDGSGYPSGLRGEAIPIEGQIVGVVDVFDALTHARPYKDAWSVEATLAELERQRNAHFSSAVLDAFLALQSENVLNSCLT